MASSDTPATAETRPGIKSALIGAASDTRRLLSGPGRAVRWKTLFALAAMAGVVGVGAAPPPIGLLQPVWADPVLHAAVFDNQVVVGGLWFLAVLLVLMGGVGRGFSLAFAEGITTGEPRTARYRAWLRKGAGHFIWSSALTLPLYAVLFLAEAVVTHDTTVQLTALVNNPYGTEAELVGLMATFTFKFILVLLPWTVLTLPAMVTMYELIPAIMARSGSGARVAVRILKDLARKSPRGVLAYLGVRYVLQMAGNGVALAVLVPCLVISSPAVIPLAGGGWLASSALGGPATNAGAATLTVGILLAAVALYCTLCAALLPVSVFLYAFAARTTANLNTQPPSR